MEFVEAMLIDKRGLLDELVSQAVTEVVKAEFDRGSTRTVLMFMQDGHCEGHGDR